MPTLRFSTPAGRKALMPEAITSVALEDGVVWIQDEHGEWFHCVDRTFDSVVKELGFNLGNHR